MEMVLNAEKNPLRLHFPPVIFRLNGSTPLRVGWAGSNAGSEYYYSEEKYIFLLDASSAQKKMIGLSADRINGPFVRSTRGKKTIELERMDGPVDLSHLVYCPQEGVTLAMNGLVTYRVFTDMFFQ